MFASVSCIDNENIRSITVYNSKLSHCCQIVAMCSVVFGTSSINIQYNWYSINPWNSELYFHFHVTSESYRDIVGELSCEFIRLLGWLWRGVTHTYAPIAHLLVHDTQLEALRIRMWTTARPCTNFRENVNGIWKQFQLKAFHTWIAPNSSSNNR